MTALQAITGQVLYFFTILVIKEYDWHYEVFEFMVNNNIAANKKMSL